MERQRVVTRDDVTTRAALVDLLLEDVEVAGRLRVDVLVSGSLIREVGPTGSLPSTSGERVTVDGAGCALVPGLHDHHIHLFALAVRENSLWCGRPDVESPEGLQARLSEGAHRSTGVRGTGPRSMGGEPEWLRAIGWDDTDAGWPDRHVLDRAVPDRPLRLQHRSGAMWVVNTAGLERMGVLRDGERLPSGVETDASGVATGRLVGSDNWLRERMGGDLPSLAAIGRSLASSGVTGLTDATAHNGAAELAAFAESRRRGDLLQNVSAMTAEVEVDCPEEIELGPVKIVLMESALPEPVALIARIVEAHRAGRTVAIHAASRVTAVLAAAALAEAGARAGDRIEHGSVVPPELAEMVAALGVTVVTQPHFVAENGDRYLAAVDTADVPWLYRCQGLLDAGIPVAAGTDAPFGDPDPWKAMAAAVERRSASGVLMGSGEELSPEQALALFTGSAKLPGGPPRRIAPGEPADLCLLDRSWADARRDLRSVAVRRTLVRGRITHDSDATLPPHGFEATVLGPRAGGGSE